MPRGNPRGNGRKARNRTPGGSAAVIGRLAEFRFRNPTDTFLRMTGAVRRYTLRSVPAWRAARVERAAALETLRQTRKRAKPRSQVVRAAAARVAAAEEGLAATRGQRRAAYLEAVKYKGMARRGLELDPRNPIYNDRAFNERLFNTFRGQMASGIPRTFALAVVDVDHLKTINTAGGHRLGDKAIEEISKLLVQEVAEKAGGFAGRFGGDEFKVFAPVSKTELKRLLESAQRRYKSLRNPNGHRFSFSAGVAGNADLTSLRRTGFERPQTAIEQLYLCADAATYKAKETRGSVIGYVKPGRH